MEDGYNMKRIICILATFTAVVLSSCSKVEETAPIRQVSSEIIGGWHLIEEYCDGIAIVDKVDIYLCINADCSFTLYQKDESQIRYFKYTGNCYSEANILIGEYSDGTPWGARYMVSFNEGRLVLSSYDKMSKMIYERKDLSDEEKQAAHTAVKSTYTAPMPKL